MVLIGFAWWCFASQAGSKWLLQTATAQVQGHAVGVRGTLLHGLYVDSLDVDVDGMQARAVGLHLKVLWLDLVRKRHLHINDLSLVRLDLNLQSQDNNDDIAVDTTPEPVEIPELPVSVQLDRLALNGLSVITDGKPLPVDVLSVLTAINIDADTALLRLDHLQLAQDTSLYQFNGNLSLRSLVEPWLFELNLHATAQDNSSDSYFCTERLLAGAATTESPANTKDCRINADLRLAGTVDNINLDLSGIAPGLDFSAQANIFPKHAFPLGQADIKLVLADDSGFDLQVLPASQTTQAQRPVTIKLNAHDFKLNPFLPGNIKNSVINLQAVFETSLDSDYKLLRLGSEINLLENTFWNGQPLAGHVRLADLSNSAGALFGDADLASLDQFKITGLGVDIQLADAKVYMAGDLAADNSKLGLNFNLPNLARLWPDLPGGADLQGVFFGNMASLSGGLKARYIIDKPDATGPMQAPVDVQLSFSGGLDHKGTWRGQFSDLNLKHDIVNVKSLNSVNFDYDLEQGWNLGQASINIGLQSDQLLTIEHQSSGGLGAQWHTQGAIPSLIIDSKRIQRLRDWLASAEQLKGTVKTDTRLSQQLELALRWNLDFADTLTGQIDLQRTSGDLTIPGDIPVDLQLQSASLDLNFKKQADHLSKIFADLQVQTHKMGSLRVRADTLLHTTDGFVLQESDTKNVHLEAESEDLAWVNLLLGGAQEIAGEITADIKASSLANGKWNLTGPLSGKGLSFVIPDQGIRLVGGELAAHFSGMHLQLDKMYFPATARVTPKDKRTVEWLASKEAQDGYLDVTGDIDLETETGQLAVALRRYPILQRADRYAMISGDIDLNAELPQLIIKGQLTTDAGWFDLDMLNDIPELSSDVVIIKRGETMPEPEPALIDMLVDIAVDMGDRFFITGFGLDTGLAGNINIHLENNKMKALGALRTRSGSIKAYGQNLSLRRGRITFQGDITNPVLDIEALRTGESVQAGVAVVGSARNPKINLVSYPEVSETEKLSWLLLGHGPDDSGGDMTLLFSVGSSLLADGEPFYKKFGLDEFSMRSGELGSTGSILPVESVVSGINSNNSLAEQRFLMASKNISSDLQLSLEQALAQTGTVARLSYKLMWRLRSEITVGTTNGLAIVYRWFSKD